MDEAGKPLDPWQRYKALSDTLDAEQDLVDLADHKARFALIILSALNAAILIGATKSPGGITTATRAGITVAVMLGIYAMCALYFFLQSIETLRPRGTPPRRPLPLEPLADLPMGMRYYEDILMRTAEEYQHTWSVLRIDNLNAELAGQIHIVARINRAKYGALRRLYFGLKVMTILAAVFALVAALVHLG